MLMELLFWRKYAGTRKTSVLLFVDHSIIVRYKLFGIFAYSAEHRKRYFPIFGRPISVAEHSALSLVETEKI